MSIEEHSIEAITTAPTPSASTTQQAQKRWYTAPGLPLWICLLLAVIIRVWLVARTHGVIEGDEVLVGIQAQHILHGELPIYFYGQPYMGSLEAYLVALLIAIGSSSVWTLRGEPILLSLLVVWLTWKLAAALADAAQLPPYAKRTFMIIAALIAAIPPLYDGVLELHTYGGYIETFILMLLLLLSALQLTRRWHTGASQRELAWRWAGTGFVVGLGFWVHPLIISAVLAAAVWIMCDRIIEAIKLRQQIARTPQRYLVATLKGLGIAMAAIPASLLGFAPALYWGASHRWQNITYVLGLGVSAHRYASIRSVTRAYATCVVPRVISGAVPKESTLLATIHSPLLIAGIVCILACAMLIAIAFLSQHPVLLRSQRLVALPLLFGACTALVFCTSKATVYVVISCNYDIAGRYATPLVLALPFFFATVFTIGNMYIWEKLPYSVGAGVGGSSLPDTFGISRRKAHGSDVVASDPAPTRAPHVHSTAPCHYMSHDHPTPDNGVVSTSAGRGAVRDVVARGWVGGGWALVGARWRTNRNVSGTEQGSPPHPSSTPAPTETTGTFLKHLPVKGLTLVLFTCLLVYLGAQAWTYGLTDPGYTFQSAYCLEAPADNEPIIAYMQQQHIHYAWASNWLAYGIVFKTNGAIIAADPLPFLPGSPNIDRIPANTEAEQHADRPTLLVFVHANDTHPLLLKYLDDQHVTYHAARFTSEPGIEVLVVTPLSRTVSPFESPAFSQIFTSCND